jgi:hypothetical protein
VLRLPLADAFRLRDEMTTDPQTVGRSAWEKELYEEFPKTEQAEILAEMRFVNSDRLTMRASHH